MLRRSDGLPRPHDRAALSQTRVFHPRDRNTHAWSLSATASRPLRLGFGCFVLQNIPVFRKHAVGHSDNIGGDPIFRPSSSRKSAVDDHVIVLGNDRPRLVLQCRWCAPYQIEQVVAPGWDVRAVLTLDAAMR
jgi:hypothetical protein